MIAGLVPLVKSYNVLVFYFMGETDLQKHSICNWENRNCGVCLQPSEVLVLKDCHGERLMMCDFNKHRECVSEPVCECASVRVCGCE